MLKAGIIPGLFISAVSKKKPALAGFFTLKISP